MFGNVSSVQPLPVSATVAPTTATPAVLPQGASATARLQQLAVTSAPLLSGMAKQERNAAPNAGSVLIPSRQSAFTTQLLAQQNGAFSEIENNAQGKGSQVLAAQASLLKAVIQQVTQPSATVQFRVLPQNLPQSAIVRDGKGSVNAYGSQAYSYTYGRIDDSNAAAKREEELSDA